MLQMAEWTPDELRNRICSEQEGSGFGKTALNTELCYRIVSRYPRPYTELFLRWLLSSAIIAEATCRSHCSAVPRAALLK